MVGTVGNFTAKKDHVTLLRAAAELRRGRPDLRLVLIGSGPLERDLRLAVDQLELQGCVSMLGSRDDVADLLAGFDVFRSARASRGCRSRCSRRWPPVWAAWRPGVGGVPKVVTDDVDGLLVEPGEPAALATAMARLLDDAELRAELGLEPGAPPAASTSAAVARTQAVYDEVLCLR